MFPRDKSKNIAMKRGRFSKRKNQTDEATRLDFDGIACSTIKLNWLFYLLLLAALHFRLVFE
jgi:hypothetical protein